MSRAISWQQQYIKEIRRNRFFMGDAQRTPLAPELHKAIKQLSVELYQNDIHFIKQIIQNAEDNIYAEDVKPSLEFLLTKEDVADVGASTTLMVFNNEKGLRTLDVDALCSVARSTKTGKRDEGFIGSKGIGFKSVFTVSETAIIISNGYRIRFCAEASEESGVGYIVPEWIESPSDDAIKAAFGGGELPMTVIILPIRNDKVDLVRKQLKELSPEVILFLSHIRELKIVDKAKNASNSGELLRITRSSRIAGITSVTCRFFRVTLHIESSEKVLDTHSYCIFQHSVPVTHPVPERQEIKEWAIALAFPHQGRPSSGSIGDVFSFLPTELKTGFPFIVNADFILTSSRETIRFDSEWNMGILGCIPAAFHLAFMIMVRQLNSVRAAGHEVALTSQLVLDKSKDAYKYLPCSNIENSYKFSSASTHPVDQRHVRRKLDIQSHQAGNLHQLEKVRDEIFLRLGSSNDHIIRLSSSIGTGSRKCWLHNSKFPLQIKSSFRTILETAAQCNHPASSVVFRRSDGSQNPSWKFAIVDGYVQQNYAAGLSALGVRHMTLDQYKSFLMDSAWLLALPDDLYFKVLTFFAFEMRILDENDLDYSNARKTYRLLKFRGEEGAVELATFDEVSKGVQYFYTLAEKEADWIWAWMKEFNPWDSMKVMPKSTSEALGSASNSEELMMWLRKHGSLTELSVQNYSQMLIDTLMVSSGHTRTHAILFLQFLYCATQEKLLSWQETTERVQKLEHFIVIDHNTKRTLTTSLKFRKDGGVLLPPTVSKWPLLFDLPRGSGRYGQSVIPLSNLYLDPQCDLAKNLVTDSRGSGSMMEFIKESVNAVDLPSFNFLSTESFPLRRPMTMQKSALLFEWLKVQLPNRRRTKKKTDNDVLLRSLKGLEWIQTIGHGWQRPTLVFLASADFHSHFMLHDLPFLDFPAYRSLLGSEHAFVLNELEVVTDVRKGCAAVADYFSTLLAEEADLEKVTRFYVYLHKFQWRPKISQQDNLDIWIPATGKSKVTVPFWRSSDECIIKDENDVFLNSSNLSVLEKIYEPSLLPFFSGVLGVPETAPVDRYFQIWLEWCQTQKATTQFDGHIQKGKVDNIWHNILPKWQDCSKERWVSFVSGAWVPVAPKSGEMVSEFLCIVPPSQVFIPDDLSISKSFSTIATAKVNVVYQLPGISSRELKSLMELYSAMGVRELSKFVTYDLSIPANVWKKHIPWGEGLVCEGLFRSVSAYLCHSANIHGLSGIERQKILSPLICAREVVVSAPFMTGWNLQTEVTVSSTATVTKRAFAFYDKAKGKLFYLARDHDLLKTEIAKRDFNTQLATTISRGILSEYPELSPGLTTLLKLLCDSRFAMDSVEYELQEQNLVIFPEDEKALVEGMATRQQTDTPKLVMGDVWDPSTRVIVPSSGLRF